MSGRTRPFPIYINSRKVAEAFQNNIDAESGDEQQFGAEGVLGLSEGITTFEIDFDVVQLTRGTNIDLFGILMNKQEVGVGVSVGPKRIRVPMRCTSANLTSQSRNGTATGKWKFKQSGTPSVT